jgi:hypothetical protein
VSIPEIAPDIRFYLSDCAWLEEQMQTRQIGKKKKEEVHEHKKIDLRSIDSDYAFPTGCLREERQKPF